MLGPEKPLPALPMSATANRGGLYPVDFSIFGLAKVGIIGLAGPETSRQRSTSKVSSIYDSFEPYSLAPPSRGRDVADQNETLLSTRTFHHAPGTMKKDAVTVRYDKLRPRRQSSCGGFRPEKENTAARMWNSLWLRKSVLIGFAALFAALFFATLLMYHFSVVLHGLSTQVTANQYGWTYGPTAREFCHRLMGPASCG